MGSGKTVLLVCRDLGEIQLLQRFRAQAGCRYLVASDDVRVHLEIGKYPWVAEVCFLEQMESFYAVAAEVIKYLELINQWLESLGDDPKGIPRELLYWISHCEGGKTTQRIQDLLLLIRSYEYLLDTHNINNVIILSHPQAEWEDDILVKVAQCKGIAVQIIGRFHFKIIKSRVLSLIKLLAREPYYIFYIVLAKLRGKLRFHKAEISKNEIVMQICSLDEKFIEDNVPIMKSLKSRGYNPVALLWGAAKAREKFLKEGLKAEELETFSPISSWWEGTYRVWLTWCVAGRRRQEFLANSGLQYHHISLGALMWPSVLFFFWEELAQRYRLLQAAQKYFVSHSPRAIRPWGGGAHPEGAIVLRGLSGKKRPFFIYWFWAFYENPYLSDYSYSDLFLAAGTNQKEFLEKHGVASQKIVSVGLSRYDYLAAFRKEHSPAQSRTCLNIPQDFQDYILLDSNGTLRGYLTRREQALVAGSLLNFAREHPAVALMIKPHPAHIPGWLEALIDCFALPNVYLIDKNMMPYHALNAADLLITKFSTLALEAMLFKTPVVSILLDGEERFRIYGDAVERVDSLDDLKEILSLLVSDERWREDWVKTQINNQASFLENYFDDNLGDAAERGAEALDKFLTDRIVD